MPCATKFTTRKRKYCVLRQILPPPKPPNGENNVFYEENEKHEKRKEIIWQKTRIFTTKKKSRSPLSINTLGSPIFDGPRDPKTTPELQKVRRSTK